MEGKRLKKQRPNGEEVMMENVKVNVGCGTRSYKNIGGGIIWRKIHVENGWKMEESDGLGRTGGSSKLNRGKMMGHGGGKSRHK
jgi:hypothetical protein